MKFDKHLSIIVVVFVVLANLPSFVAFSNGQASSILIASYGVVSKGALFSSGFEIGSFSEWQPLQESVYQSPPSTECSIITKEQGAVRTGNYSYLAQCDTRLPNWQQGAKLWNWITKITYGFYTAYVYLPNDYALRDRDEWDLFIQFKEQDYPYDVTWGLLLKNYSRTLSGRPPLEIMLLQGGAVNGGINSYFKQGQPVEFPRGKWVKIVIEYRVDHTEGLFRVWQDDLLLFERTNVDTRGSSGSQYVMWGLCCYPNLAAGSSHQGPPILRIFYDDCSIVSP